MKYLKRGSSQGKPPETQLSSRVFESEPWKGNCCCPDGFKGVHLDIQKGKKHLLNNYGGVLEAHGYKSCPHAERLYTFPNKNATRTEVLSESS